MIAELCKEDDQKWNETLKVAKQSFECLVNDKYLVG